ncbi:MAG: hypothetical protein HOF24_06200, partial [Flavobacteriaceae bacterium]|nr:hypothetical protein [Flavobacteriaceae bacterium]
NDILNNGDEEKYLLIQKSKTICLDCPKQLLGKENPEDETWENRLNKSYE